MIADSKISNFQDLNQSFQNLQEQVQEFNNNLTKNDLDEKSLRKISQIVKEEINKLQKFKESFKEKKNQAPSRKYVRKVTIGAIVSGAFAIASFAVEKLIESKIGKGISIAAFGLSSLAVVYTSYKGTQANFASIDAAEFEDLEKSLEHAENFQKFLSEFKEINENRRKLIENMNSHQEKKELSSIINSPNSSGEELDEKISSCLKHWHELPASYKNKEIYLKIFAILIQALPENDPLKTFLFNLKKPEKTKKISLNQSVKELYLPEIQNYSESQDVQNSDESEWDNEKISAKKEAISLEELENQSNFLSKQSGKQETQFPSLTSIVERIFKITSFLPFLSGKKEIKELSSEISESVHINIPLKKDEKSNHSAFEEIIIEEN